MFINKENEEVQNISIVVIFAKYHGNWIVCKHKGRTTVECPGGHVEKHEVPYQAACRELYEETGAKEFSVVLVDSYSYTGEGGDLVYAQLYYADIVELGELPKYEIEKIYIKDSLDLNWTYPDIQYFLNGIILDFLKKQRE